MMMKANSDTLDDSIFELDEEEVKVVICQPIPQLGKPRLPTAAWYVDFEEDAAVRAVPQFKLDENYCRKILEKYCR